MSRKTPPDGYSEFHEYNVPEKLIGVGTFLLMVGIGEALFPGAVGWYIDGVSNDLVGLLTVSLDEIFLISVMIVVHEGIHYAVGTVQGYSPKAGVRFVKHIHGIKEPSPYVVVLDEFISREENLAMLAAPLVVINGAAIVALLPVFPEAVAHYAKVVLVVNTAASLQDIYNVVRIWTFEKGTLFFNTLGEEFQTDYCKPDN